MLIERGSLHDPCNVEAQLKAEEYITGLLLLLGDDPNREGLAETPKRVVKMLREVLEGMQYTNDEIACMFDKCFDEEDIKGHYEGMVLIKDIPIFSFCEHHLALMYNMKVTVAYIPRERVIGLSKVARIADMVGKRLQLQERIGKDIVEIISMVTGSPDVAVIIEGEHACMSTRGIRKPGTLTRTSTLRGEFMTDPALRNELLLLNQ